MGGSSGKDSYGGFGGGETPASCNLNPALYRLIFSVVYSFNGKNGCQPQLVCKMRINVKIKKVINENKNVKIKYVVRS